MDSIMLFLNEGILLEEMVEVRSEERRVGKECLL